LVDLIIEETDVFFYCFKQKRYSALSSIWVTTLNIIEPFFGIRDILWYNNGAIKW